MNEKLHQQLIKDTEKLRKIVGVSSTEEITRKCAVSFIVNDFSSEDGKHALLSPVRQLFYLLGLMISTPEPRKLTEYTPFKWNDSIRLLNSIAHTYSFMFWATPGEFADLTEEWKEKRRVSMPTFLHYFNTGLLASVEQVSQRIEKYLQPFDKEIHSRFGISASDSLHVANWISTKMDETLFGLFDRSDAERKARHKLLDRMYNEKWPIERLRQEAQGTEYFQHFSKLMEGMHSVFKISLDSLKENFSVEIADSYWNSFVAHRGEANEFTYFTEHNIAEDKPLFEISSGLAACPFKNALYWSILKVSENLLYSEKTIVSFTRKRDKILETEVAFQFRRLFGDSAEYYSNIFETKALQYEHDLIVIWNKQLFIVEAKASPPNEPFRDPDKAFKRLRDAFHKDTGIQKAYEQAHRLELKLNSGDTVSLYDNKRTKLIDFQKDDFDKIFCICVTRDDYGPLATDLSLLLEKEEGDSYPWAVNIFDFESIINAWEYLKWGPGKFCSYLEGRILLNGKVFSTDELEIVGFLIKHGSLSFLLDAEVDLIELEPDYASVFDKIYLAEKGGDPFVYEPKDPIMDDLGQIWSDLMQGIVKDSPSEGMRVKKQGRNELCECGSGKKYKNCCGKSV